MNWTTFGVDALPNFPKGFVFLFYKTSMAMAYET
jgi:hypothetical protein